MTVYIDEEFMCHVEPGEGRRAVECSFFDGKCRKLIEGYRYVPSGETWVRDDGQEFHGEMISPGVDYAILHSAQEQNDEIQAELSSAYAQGVNSI